MKRMAQEEAKSGNEQNRKGLGLEEGDDLYPVVQRRQRMGNGKWAKSWLPGKTVTTNLQSRRGNKQL